MIKLDVQPGAWQQVPRYIGYDRFLRRHLQQGPDFALVSKCHAAMLEGVRVRDCQRCMSRIEQRGSPDHTLLLDAFGKRQREALRRLVREAAQLPAKTDCGLTWKGDALIHLLDDFDIEGLPEIVDLARIYACDVSHRFEVAGPVAGRDCAHVIAARRDCEFCLAVQNARDALHRYDEIVAKVALPRRPVRAEAVREMEAAEEALLAAEWEARARLEACRCLCPACLEDIHALAQLILLLIGEEDRPHRQRLAAEEFSRTLAHAVRCAIGVDLLEPGRANHA
jgi:hypothetical protein